MKNKALNCSTAFVLCLIAALSVKAQVAETPLLKTVNDSKIKVLEGKITLKPGQRSGEIRVPDSCLVLLTDFQMRLTIPLDKTFETVLPAGTKIFVPNGVYNLENLTNQPVSFQLYKGLDCSDIQIFQKN